MEGRSSKILADCCELGTSLPELKSVVALAPKYGFNCYIVYALLKYAVWQDFQWKKIGLVSFRFFEFNFRINICRIFICIRMSNTHTKHTKNSANITNKILKI